MCMSEKGGVEVPIKSIKSDNKLEVTSRLFLFGPYKTHGYRMSTEHSPIFQLLADLRMETLLTSYLNNVN